jgi:hypothetical protein
MFVEDIKDVFANLCKLRLYFLAVTLDSLIIDTWASLPLDSSFCSMEDTIRQEARLAPMRFLYATESGLRSSTVSSQCGLENTKDKSKYLH